MNLSFAELQRKNVVITGGGGVLGRSPAVAVAALRCGSAWFPRRASDTVAGGAGEVAVAPGDRKVPSGNGSHDPQGRHRAATGRPGTGAEPRQPSLVRRTRSMFSPMIFRISSSR
jgi:hypothetical protein